MRVTMHCPHCGGAIDVHLGEPDTTEVLIWEAFMHYLAWGEKSHYKAHFEKVGDYRWRYSVQVYDPPLGDTWVRGEFEWRPPTAPVFLSTETSRF